MKKVGKRRKKRKGQHTEPAKTREPGASCHHGTDIPPPNVEQREERKKEEKRKKKRKREERKTKKGKWEKRERVERNDLSRDCEPGVIWHHGADTPCRI